MLWGGRNWSNGTAGRWALLRGAGRGYHVPGSGPRRRAPRSCGLGCRLSWPFRGVGHNRTRTRAKLWLRASASDNLRRGRIKTLTRHRDAAAPTCLRLGLVQACAAGVDRCGDDDDATRVDVEVAAPLCRGVSIRPPPPPSGQPGVVRCPRLRSPLLAPTPITCVVAMPSSLSLRPPTMPCPIAPPPSRSTAARSPVVRPPSFRSSPGSGGVGAGGQSHSQAVFVGGGLCRALCVAVPRRLPSFCRHADVVCRCPSAEPFSSRRSVPCNPTSE